MGFFQTEFSCYSVEWSPFDETKLACATSQHFGIIGNGRQYVLDVHPSSGQIQVLNVFDTQDGLYDCAWSEQNERHLVSASGDGSLKLWDITAHHHSRPLISYEEHRQEVYSVDWNLVRKDTFLSGSWDQTIKLWDPLSPRSLHTFAEHTGCVYSAIWSPYNQDMFASVAGDSLLKIWDLRNRRSTVTIRAHEDEALTCDWNKYHEFLVVTGSVDKTIRIWDIRSTRSEIMRLHGHTYAVRRIKCSPHHASTIVSCSYDMSLKHWDTEAPDDPLIQSLDHHTEFVVGVDFNIFIPNQIATCSWDQTVHIFFLQH